MVDINPKRKGNVGVGANRVGDLRDPGEGGHGQEPAWFLLPFL